MKRTLNAEMPRPSSSLTDLSVSSSLTSTMISPLSASKMSSAATLPTSSSIRQVSSVASAAPPA